MLADMFNWSVCVRVCESTLSSVCVEIVFCGLILPVVRFSLITGLYVEMSKYLN